jgi:hypothetical protein
VHRFEFTFTPKHGSWLNLVEGFFSKLARSVLRHIRVASKQELKDRLMAAVDYFNRDPVVNTWTYKASVDDEVVALGLARDRFIDGGIEQVIGLVRPLRAPAVEVDPVYAFLSQSANS